MKMSSSIGLAVEVTNATYFFTLHYGGPEFTAMVNTLIIPLGGLGSCAAGAMDP